MKTAVYTRVSTKKGEQESSIKLQKEVYEDYCKQKGYELHKIYADKETATNVRTRTDFISMLHDAGLDYERNSNNGYDTFIKSKRQPRFDLIIVKDVARWSRNTHLGLLIVEYLRDKGVYVLFETAGLNTKDDDWHMRLSMLFTIAQNESHNLSRRVKFSRKHNAKKGRYAPSRLSLGYIRNEKNEIVIDEKQAEVVKKIFELYKEHGGKIIAQILNEEGYRSQTGKPFSADIVLKIIKNKLYTGTAIVNRSVRINVTDTYRVDVPKEEWIEIPNAVEPIISLATWNEANSKRKKNINRSAVKGRKPAINDDFFMKIYCSKCGARFVRHQGRNNENSPIKLSYMCQTRRKKKGVENCDARAISYNILNSMLGSIDISYVVNELSNAVHNRYLQNRIDSEIANIESTVKDLENQQSTINQENDKLVLAIADTFLQDSKETVAILKKKVESNKKKFDELESQKQKINIETLRALKIQCINKKKLINDIENNKDLSRNEKLKMLKKIIVDNYSVKFIFSMPSFEDEIDEFNSIFPDDPIFIEIDVNSFLTKEQNESLDESIIIELGFDSKEVTFARTHKEAQEYWEKKRKT